MSPDYVVYALVAVGAALLLWFLYKVVKFVIFLAVAGIVITLVVFYLVHAGYVSEETVARFNPANSEAFRASVGKVQEWAKDKTRRAVREAVDETLEGARD